MRPNEGIVSAMREKGSVGKDGEEMRRRRSDEPSERGRSLWCWRRHAGEERSVARIQNLFLVGLCVRVARLWGVYASGQDRQESSSTPFWI
jgi:hypothetical protein